MLRSKSKHQYMLVDGGFLLKTVDPSQIDDLADDLFAELVAEAPPPDAEDQEIREASRQLAKNSQRAMDESGISKRGDYWKDFDWFCPVGGTKQHFRFDYAIHHAAEPRIVFQRVLLWRLQSVHSTAFRFQSMQTAYDWPKERCTALVYAADGQLVQNDDSREALTMMNEIGAVVDVRGVEHAAATLLTLVV